MAKKLKRLPPRECNKTKGENEQETRDQYRIPVPSKGKFLSDLSKATQKRPK